MQEHGPIDLDRLRVGWTPLAVGRRIVWLDETASTNSLALERAAEPDAHGLVVIADFQTGGRGRQGRRWLSPRGASVLCSVVVVPPVEANMKSAEQTHAAVSGRLNLVAAVAANEAIAQATELRPGIKWPNDLRIAGKKVGGILIESSPLDAGRRAWVLGFGINCLQHAGHFPPELADQATSLELASSHAVDRTGLIRLLLMRLDQWLDRADWAHDPRLLHAWESMAEPIGQRITLRYQRQEYTGRTVAVDPVGGLTVQLDSGRQMWFDPMLTSVVPS
jgi:BirA family transcriptional regulator, biotin operon repressor / biotin---[acetyl-CoA-carboxylase] ligase